MRPTPIRRDTIATIRLLVWEGDGHAHSQAFPIGLIRSTSDYCLAKPGAIRVWILGEREPLIVMETIESLHARLGWVEYEYRAEREA